MGLKGGQEREQLERGGGRKRNQLLGKRMTEETAWYEEGDKRRSSLKGGEGRKRTQLGRRRGKGGKSCRRGRREKSVEGGGKSSLKS